MYRFYLSWTVLSLLFWAMPAFQGKSCFEDDAKRLCYYTNWAQYREGKARFLPEHIDSTLCTHIIFAFATMEKNQLAEAEYNDAEMYKKVNLHKQVNPRLKTLLAVGGYNFGTARMTAMIASKANRSTFVDTAILYLRSHNFDGLDLDFEFPGSGDSPKADKQRFTLLCKELREAFEYEYMVTGRERLLLTAAVSAGKLAIDAGYEIKELAKWLDFANLLSYDFHGAHDKTAELHAPLYPRRDETHSQRYLNVEWAAHYWMSHGMPPHKLVIGIPTYGRGFTLADGNRHRLGDPTVGVSLPGRYTQEKGLLAYWEICDAMKMTSSADFDYDHNGHYLHYNETQWVGFDDQTSAMIKGEWIKRSGFAGFLVWTLDFDDFRNSSCDSGNYPLIKAVIRGMQSAPTVQPPI